MYTVRKPYTVSSFQDLEQFGVSYKIVLVTAQVFGYMLSKFIGIKLVSGVAPARRPLLIILLISIGWLSLLFFALVPFSFKFIFLFINGLPLGIIWGLVFSYLEGRKFTDLMGALLATSFIISSGLAKTIGGLVLLYTPFDQWSMPFIVASCFMPIMILFTILLNKLPSPNVSDQQERTPRKPMTNSDRRTIINSYGALLIPPVLGYMLLTILRDFCEDFAVELWSEANKNQNVFLFTQTSTISGLLVMGLIGFLFLIRNNFKAFQIIHLFIVSGFTIIIFSTLLYQFQLINSIIWMIASITGLYMGYVASNSIFYERMLASFKIEGNVGFVMYIADAFGYMATVLVLIVNDYFKLTLNWVNFFINAFYICGVLGIILLLISWLGFSKKYQQFSHA